MKKTILFAGIIVAGISNAQTIFNGGTTSSASIYRDGKTGFGMSSAPSSHKVEIETTTADDGIMITQKSTTNGSRGAAGVYLSNVTGHNWGLFSTGTDNNVGANHFTIYDLSPYPAAPRFFISGTNGNVGIGNTAPEDKLQVGSDYRKVVMGDASGSALGYGAAYLGFNASRNSGSWATTNDGGNNGASVIYGDIVGDINFMTIGSTGASNQSLSDATAYSDIRMKINPKGTISLFNVSANGTDDAFSITDGAYGGSGTINFKVKKNGTVYAREINVQSTTFPDYVFNNDYKLMSLKELDSYIQSNHHLPNVPAASEVEKNGANLSEMNKVQMEKIEELTLYILQLQKKIESLEKKMK